MADLLTIALPKGRLEASAAELFARCGIELDAEAFNGRKLAAEVPERGLRFIRVKPWDVPVYVEYGIADLGIAGGDVIEERGSDVYVPVALGFGKCRMAVAAVDGSAGLSHTSAVRVATKYPNTATRFFAGRGLAVEIIELQGSVEIAPVLGLADRIVDIVETGKTLDANGLVVTEEIAQHQAHVLVCRSSLITQTERIQTLLAEIAGAVDA